MKLTIVKKKIICLLMIIIGLPLAVMSAVSQDIVLGSIFGFTFCLGIDWLVDIYNESRII